MCQDVQALVQKLDMQKSLGVSSRKFTMNFNLLHYFVHIRKLSFFRVTQKHTLFAVHCRHRPGTYHTE
jgi:hypothetical protein